MRVGIDGRALLGQKTGIGSYTRGIARALAARRGLTVALFSPRPVEEDGLPVRCDAHPFGMVWVQTTLSRRLEAWGADVLLASLTVGPARGGLPFVSVVHDLTPLTHPEWHAARTLIGFVPLWERTVERAGRFVCVSETTARHLTALYPETAGRVRVARNGVDPIFRPGGDPSWREHTRRRYANGRPYMLYLGTLEPRKNVETLVVACERLWARRRSLPDLVLAGGAGWKTASLHRRITASPFRDKIHRTGYARREEAVDLYRAAELFVYPSLAEGFGLPVVEAMACGVPVVASSAEALVEVCGDAALYADPRDPAALARQIERALEEEETRRVLTQRGTARAAGFTWEAAAEPTASALAEAVGESA
jgi:glycosyltransferase involved in cell wall biosynthesis